MTNEIRPEIEHFAKALVELVRDPAINAGEMSIRSRNLSGLRWRAAAESGGVEEAVRAAWIEAVDDAIAQLLFAIEEGQLRLKLETPDGDDVDLQAAGNGEMVGWYMAPAEYSWRAKYSKHRVFLE